MSPLSASTSASSTVDRSTRKVMLETGLIEVRQRARRVQMSEIRNEGDETNGGISPNGDFSTASGGRLSESDVDDSVASNGSRTRRPIGDRCNSSPGLEV